jgi:outer membrane protein OmpA-like peptidoglycan-associated protein
VESATAFDTATVVTWTVRWDDPDKPNSHYREMASVVHNNVTFVPTLSDRAAMQVYFPLCTVNSWHPDEKRDDGTDLTDCAFAGLFAPNDRDRSDGIRLVNHQAVAGWAVFPPVGPETSAVDLALPHGLPAFFALPVTRATGAPTADGSLASVLANLQVTDEMRSRATFTSDAGGTVFPFTRTDGATISLATDLLFEVGRTDLTETAQAALAGLAGQIPAGAAVTVDGYTDSIMSNEVNIPTSRAQAQAVADALAAARPDLRLTVVGHGSDSPVAANSNRNGTDRPTGRQLNRRVTLTY